MLSSNSSYQAGESSFFSIARLYIGDCFAKTLNRRSEQRVGHLTHTLSTGKISTMLLQNQAITYICQLRQTCMPWRVLALKKAWKVRLSVALFNLVSHVVVTTIPYCSFLASWFIHFDMTLKDYIIQPCMPTKSKHCLSWMFLHKRDW